MAEGSETVRAVSRGLFEGLGLKLTEGLNKVVDHATTTLAPKILEIITQDVFDVKGHWDDTVVNIIKAKFRKKRGEDAYQALMRLIGFLTEPEHQEFGVISIGVLALSHKEEPLAKRKAPKTAEKEKGKKSLSVVERNLGLFLDIDLNDPENYTILFDSYDFLISDFKQLEKEGRANRDEVVQLMHLSSLYADNTVKKRLAGAWMHVRDWPATLRRWREQGWRRIVDSFKTVDNYLNTELKQPLTELEQHSIDALAQAREFFNNSRR